MAKFTKEEIKEIESNIQKKLKKRVTDDNKNNVISSENVEKDEEVNDSGDGKNNLSRVLVIIVLIVISFFVLKYFSDKNIKKSGIDAGTDKNNSNEIIKLKKDSKEIVFDKKVNDKFILALKNTLKQKTSTSYSAVDINIYDSKDNKKIALIKSGITFNTDLKTNNTKISIKDAVFYLNTGIAPFNGSLSAEVIIADNNIYFKINKLSKILSLKLNNTIKTNIWYKVPEDMLQNKKIKNSNDVLAEFINYQEKNPVVILKELEKGKKFALSLDIKNTEKYILNYLKKYTNNVKKNKDLTKKITQTENNISLILKTFEESVLKNSSFLIIKNNLISSKTVDIEGEIYFNEFGKKTNNSNNKAKYDIVFTEKKSYNKVFSIERPEKFEVFSISNGSNKAENSTKKTLDEKNKK